MENKINNRKEFIKKLALGISGMVVPNSATTANSNQIQVKLADKQLLFLAEYKLWLKEFHTYIQTRNKSPLDIENNKKLMLLSEEADKRKPMLEQYMKDIVFAAYFNHISEETSKII